jgi:micrococcal nuclease
VNKFKSYGLLCLMFLLLLVPPAFSNPRAPWTPTPNSGGNAAQPQSVSALVTRVIDGDTIVVKIGNELFTVRYIGINTPETDETCGADATSANESLVYNQWVSLVKDKSETDQYGRLLRYVYRGQQFVNAELVKSGWAEAKAYPPDTKFEAQLEALETQAHQANIGCHAQGSFGGPSTVVSTSVVVTSTPRPSWSTPTRGWSTTTPTRTWSTPTRGLATPTPFATYPSPTQQPPSSNCSPSYPDVCIPPPPPDLDCGDIPYRRFRVLSPDPHHFDRDHNGIGCES